MLTFCPTWKVQHSLLTSTEDSPHRKIKLFTVRQYSEQLARCSLDHLLITSDVVFHIYIIQSDWTVESSQSSPVFIAQNLIKVSVESLCICEFWAYGFLFSVQMYMSPELVLCRGHNTKTDIYSLGTTIIHMLSGSPPWVRRYPRTAYPSYLYIVSVLIRYYQNALNCLNF